MIYLVGVLSAVVGTLLGFWFGFKLGLSTKMQLSADVTDMLIHSLRGAVHTQYVDVQWESDMDGDLQ